MIKPDTILRQTTIAAIKRHAMVPHQWDYTRFYETEKHHDLGAIAIELGFDQNELPVAPTIRTPTDWTFVTTRRVIGKIHGLKVEFDLSDLKEYRWGNFKEHKEGHTITTIDLKTIHGQTNQFIIETGKASMVMIYAIKTLRRLVQGNSLSDTVEKKL